MAMGGKRNGDDENGSQLWRDYTRDVIPLENDRPDPPVMAAPSPVLPSPERLRQSTPPRPVRPPGGQIQGRELDGGTARRLKQGKLTIEGRLDLHGLSQIQAHDRLVRFVQSAHGQGKRCLLVITGKGSVGEEGGRGILRRRLPEWLDLPILRPIVLKAVSAAQKDGGAGAFYIYLRRMRQTD